MANLFKFANPTTNTIALEKGRTGTVRQTVTNESGRSLQAITRIDVTPPDSPAKDWIRVEPKGTTPMKVNGTAHFDVIVEVPEGKTLDKPVTFKLTVADEFAPEENFSTGPDMSFVPPGQMPVKKSNKGLIIGAIVAVVVLVLVGIGIVIALSGGDKSPRLKLLDDVTVYSAPDTASAPVTDLTEGVEVPVSQRTNDDGWFLVTLENGETGWVEADDNDVEQAGDFAAVALFTTSTPTATQVPEIPTATPTETATMIVVASDTATLTPTDAPTETPTATPEPALTTMAAQFKLIDNSVEYYIRLTEPGTIRVLPSWVGFEIDMVISILDLGDRTVANLSTDVSGFPVEYVVTDAEWQANKVWRINITNSTMNQATGTIEISYPSGSITGQPFRDQFILRPDAANANIVVPLSGPGPISAQTNWGGAGDAIETRIRLPQQGDGFMASKREPSGMTVSYDVPDLAIGDLWVINLVRQTPGLISGSLTVRYP